MKSILIAALFLSVSTAFAGQIKTIKCKTEPYLAAFTLSFDQNLGTFNGKGLLGFNSFKLNCKKPTNPNQLVCESPADSFKPASAVIIIDDQGAIEALVQFETGDLQMGCVANI